MTTPTMVHTLYDGFFKFEAWHVPGASNGAHLVLRTNDSVVGLLYDEINKRVLLVRQRRPAMVRPDNPEGFITEAVAGRFDVNLGPKALLVKEAKEEAGVMITEDDVELLNNGVPMALSAGALTERSYLAFAKITSKSLTGTDDQTFGVEGEGEAIRRVWVPLSQLLEHPFEDVRVLCLVQHLQLKLTRIP